MGPKFTILDPLFSKYLKLCDRMSNNHASRIKAHKSTSLKPIFGKNCDVVWKFNFLIGCKSNKYMSRVSWSNIGTWNFPGTFLIFRAIVSLYILKTPDQLLADPYFGTPRKVWKLLYCISGPLKRRFWGKSQQGNRDKQNQSSHHQSHFFCQLRIFKFSACKIGKSVGHLNQKK